LGGIWFHHFIVQKTTRARLNGRGWFEIQSWAGSINDLDHLVRAGRKSSAWRGTFVPAPVLSTRSVLDRYL